MDSEPNSDGPALVVVMGVSGSGKTLIGQALAEKLGAAFAEGDRLHPAENIARMSAGRPLRDEDRWGWLDAVAAEIGNHARAGLPLVVACSALKRAYRDRLRKASPRMRFVFLDIDRETAAERVAARKGHFMPASLVDSQFADLEPPRADERALRLDARRAVEELAAAAATFARSEAPARL